MNTIVVVSQYIISINIIESVLKNLYKILVFSKIEPALDYIYNSMPDLMILAINMDDSFTINILNSLKKDPIFNQLPVLAVLPDQFDISRWDSSFAEDYIWETDLEREILTRVNLCIIRSKRVVEINPLTRLPGNISINRQIQDRLDKGKEFAFAYADLDYFKPFNDYYGFGRGDEVIRIAGRLILNIVKNKQSNNSFIGHIGGDDFIFIMDLDLIEETSQEIIDAFDKIIPTFYDPEDRMKNCIESIDRQNHVRTFPIMSISIGITSTKTGTFSHYGEITERASEMKKYAKQFKDSCYKLDRRRDLLAWQSRLTVDPIPRE
jgi:diguanylate cyclase (GGDEF)-like protein